MTIPQAQVFPTKYRCPECGFFTYVLIVDDDDPKIPCPKPRVHKDKPPLLEKVMDS